VAAPVFDAHIGLRRDQPNPGAQDIAQRAVGVGQAEKQVRMFVIRGAGDDAAVAEQDVGLDQPVVHEAMTEAGGLDADADDGAGNGNMLEFGRHRGQETLRQRVGNELFVGYQTLGFDRGRLGVEVEHVVELGQRDRTVALLLARPVAERFELLPLRTRKLPSVLAQASITSLLRCA